jgi:SAM-dependent methyltransferase
MLELKKILSLIESPERLSASDAAVHEAFWWSYPRFRFFKSLPVGSRLLDLGAGSGGLALWRNWLEPFRTDIRMFGVDLAIGQYAKLYDRWWTGNLDIGHPNFENQKFDAFLASHFIEHLASLPKLIAYLAQVSEPGARLYFEWPAPHTINLPSAKVIAVHGFHIQTLNFYDDGSHIQTYSLDEVTMALEREGFTVVEQGEIRLAALAQELLARGRRTDELTWRQMGLWAAIGWCNYLTAEAA